MNRIVVAAAAAALSLVSTSAFADPMSFSAFDPTTQGANVTFTAAPGAPLGGTITGTSNKEVTYTLLADNLALLANFTFSATTSDAAKTQGGLVTQTGWAGTIDFTSKSAFSLNGMNYGAGTNLLHVAFNDAFLAGAGSSGGVFGSDETLAPGTSIVFTSAIESFANSVARGFSFSLTSASPILKQTAGQLRSFTGVVTGSFSTDPQPILNGVPEASSWALLIMGFGIAGAGLRRTRVSRQRQLVAA